MPTPQSSSDVMAIWTIFDHPKDYPIGFIARKFTVSNGKAVTTLETRQGGTLEHVRAQLPPGLFNIGRSSGDDAKIVESWL